jgi:nitroreductase
MPHREGVSSDKEHGMKMVFSAPVTDIIQRRFSCRTFSGEPVPAAALTRLSEASSSVHSGPLGSSLRFSLVAATAEDHGALKGLGTYGTIRGAAAFLLGAARPGGARPGTEAQAARPGGQYLEDFGYEFERLILLATDLGMGSCWLGGFFSRGAFSRRMQLAKDERIPAVAALGLIPDDQEAARQGVMRVAVGGSRRKPWEELFFDGGLGTPLARESAGVYCTLLEMLRLAPSASNKQPWRIIRQGKAWHFFLKRTPGYPGRVPMGLFRIEDIQRVDIGIAMCHFELAAREQGLEGAWAVRVPAPAEAGVEYVVSWEG